MTVSDGLGRRLRSSAWLRLVAARLLEKEVVAVAVVVVIVVIVVVVLVTVACVIGAFVTKLLSW